MDEVRRIAILGSTGSIGQQTLEIIRAFPDKLSVFALAARSSTAILEQQAEEFRPELLSIGEQTASLEHMASHPDVDLVVVATSGKAGLLPTLAAIGAGKPVALANKEALVMAGESVMQEARTRGVEIRPVDSEHSAIWQCVQGEKENPIAQIMLTASGGPFWHRSRDDLSTVTAEEALRHPTWRMGPKVTIDSATLMNKGMEVIEAHWLFAVPFDKIKVVVHPGSIVHSLVEFSDGSMKAQLGMPDMRLPIQYALSHPERWENPALPKIDFDRLESLPFERIDLGQFPCLRLAIEAGIAGNTCPAVLSAADEIAVARFLRREIEFLDIPELLQSVMESHNPVAEPSLNDILAADAWAREVAQEWLPK